MDRAAKVSLDLCYPPFVLGAAADIACLVPRICIFSLLAP
jgi:hypothetical protein